ncbi:MAG: START domain-containing protein, partial [Bacteroidota bacterium]
LILTIFTLRVIATLGFLALTQVPAWGQEEAPFELRADEHGVKVYTRPESNDDMSVRVTTTADAKVSDVLAVLDGAPAYPEWVHRCREAYVLPGGSSDQYTYYSRVRMPFPFQDREVVAAITQNIDSGTGVLARYISATPEALPPTKGCVRMDTYEAIWIVTPTSEGVDISCTVRTSAGSGLPAWLRREIMTGGPVKTVRNLVARLEGLSLRGAHH